MAAALGGHLTLVELLLDRGADPNVKLARVRRAPSHRRVSAAAHRRPGNAARGARRRSRLTPPAPAWAPLPRARRAAQDGGTLLHRSASLGGDLALAELLLDRGADVHAEDAVRARRGGARRTARRGSCAAARDALRRGPR